MSGKKIIPCLDTKGGRVVKGTNFINLKDAGDPIELAVYYDKAGADELVLLDITAPDEGRETMVELVRSVAAKVSLPVTVGGGIGSLEDIEAVFKAGADKVSMSSAAVLKPQLVREAATRFGGRRVVVAVDAKQTDGNRWEVVIHGGRKRTGMDVLEWAKKAEELGAGELLLTSMDRDGTKDGYDISLTRAVAQAVNIPVIASGGVGNLEHLYEGLTEGGARGVLAASIFHFGEYTILEAKKYLRTKGVDI
ncbi:MAG TPA: imidazole glycerol phosphate synthase subunit HisF [Clostridia bacterium]|nr:imidazole glycerol phosphate synthase subunit HisF [Clostridia bacterium]